MANRVQSIWDSTEPSQWHYVEGLLNPADDASRGLRGKELRHSNGGLKDRISYGNQKVVGLNIRLKRTFHKMIRSLKNQW